MAKKNAYEASVDQYYANAGKPGGMSLKGGKSSKINLPVVGSVSYLAAAAGAAAIYYMWIYEEPKSWFG